MTSVGDDLLSARDEQRLAELATGLTHVTYVLGLEPEAHVRYISNSLFNFAGYRPAEFRADPDVAFGVVDPDDLQAAAQLVRDAPPGQIVSCTVRVRARDGATLWTHHRCCKELQPDGTPVIFGAARNETEEVLRARELAASRERLQLVLENAGDVVLDLTPDRRLQWVSASVERVLGWQPDELLGRDPDELIHPDDRARSRAAGLVASGTSAGVVRFRVRCADESYKWVSGVAREIRHNGDVPWGYVVGLHDIDEVVRAEHAVVESERFFRVLAENSADLVFRSSADDRLLWMSASLSDVLGFAPGELVGRDLLELVHPDDLPRVRATARGIEAGQLLRFEARIRRADGGHRWMDVRLRTVLDDAGAVLGGVGSARDIDDEVRTRIQLVDSERRARGALDSAPVGTAIADLERRFVNVNPALCRMLERDERWLLAHGMQDILEHSFDEVDWQLREQVRTGQTLAARGENVLVRADGSRVWVEHSVGMLRDDRGQPRAYICQFVDITESKKDGERLAYEARHDALTQLLTRMGLMEGLARVQSHPPRSGGRIAVVFMDVDNLKQINDGMGHAAGDAVLAEIARRVRDCARSDDLVGRLGGDEIVVALPDVHDVRAPLAVAAKIRSRLCDPVEVDHQALVPTVSIGVAVAQPGEDAESLINRADLAMYRAKRAGRDQVVAFDPALDGPVAPIAASGGRKDRRPVGNGGRPSPRAG